MPRTLVTTITVCLMYLALDLAIVIFAALAFVGLLWVLWGESTRGCVDVSVSPIPARDRNAKAVHLRSSCCQGISTPYIDHPIKQSEQREYDGLLDRQALR